MNIPTIPICPPKKDTIIIRPTGCSNNKNYITWNDIKNKPFQNIDKTFFSVDTSGNITLSKELNNNINYLNITVNEIKTDLDTRIVTEEDIVILLTNQGYISPIGANDGTIYTDNNNKIYIL